MNKLREDTATFDECFDIIGYGLALEHLEFLDTGKSTHSTALLSVIVKKSTIYLENVLLLSCKHDIMPYDK